MKTKNKTKGKVKKQQKKKIIVASLAVGAAGILGYFGWQYLKKKKETKKSGDLDQALKTVLPSTTYTSSPITATVKPKKTSYKPGEVSQSSENFPLKKGSRGEKVKVLQEALIDKYGKSILPRYGADGDFGSETAAALKKVGLPPIVTESAFNVLTQTIKIDKSSLGKDLYSAAIAKDFNKVLKLLKTIVSTEDYSTANESFKTYRIGGVRQTIVNGLLNTFTTPDQKEKIKFEFLRIGLQFDGSKWSLSGFDGLPIITKQTATVWINANQGVKVPAKMVLGNEISRRLDYTLFENNGKYFLVNTKSVQYL